MASPLEQVAKGDPVRATLQNQIINGVNASLRMQGNVIMGPGGITIPTIANLFPNARLGRVIHAISEDMTSTYKIGRLVAVNNGLVGVAGGGEDESDAAITVEEISNTSRRPVAVVYEEVSPSQGMVITDGLAYVRVIRPAVTFADQAEEDAYEVALTTNGVVRPQILSSDPESGEYGTGDAQIGVITFGVGCADLVWEEQVDDPLKEHWALVNLNQVGWGSVLAEATGAEAAEKVRVRFIDVLGEKIGEEIELPTISESDVSVGGKVLVLPTALGFAACQVGGGGTTIDIVQAVADGTLGAIPVKLLTLKADLSLSPNYTQAASATTVAYFKF